MHPFTSPYHLSSSTLPNNYNQYLLLNSLLSPQLNPNFQSIQNALIQSQLQKRHLPPLSLAEPWDNPRKYVKSEKQALSSSPNLAVSFQDGDKSPLSSFSGHQLSLPEKGVPNSHKIKEDRELKGGEKGNSLLKDSNNKEIILLDDDNEEDEKDSEEEEDCVIIQEEKEENKGLSYLPGKVRENNPSLSMVNSQLAYNLSRHAHMCQFITQNNILQNSINRQFAASVYSNPHLLNLIQHKQVFNNGVSQYPVMAPSFNNFKQQLHHQHPRLTRQSFNFRLVQNLDDQDNKVEVIKIDDEKDDMMSLGLNAISRRLSQYKKSQQENSGDFVEINPHLLLETQSKAAAVDNSNVFEEIEIPIGEEFQVTKLPKFCLNRKKVERKRKGPKVIWEPHSIEKGALDQFFEDFGRVIRKDQLREEIVLQVLREHKLNTEQALSAVKRNKLEYRKLLKMEMKE